MKITLYSGLWIAFGVLQVAAFLLMHRWRAWWRLVLVTGLAVMAGLCFGGRHGSWTDALLGAVIFGLFDLMVMLDIGPGPKRYHLGVARSRTARRALRVSEALIVCALLVWVLEIASVVVVLGLVVGSGAALAAHLSNGFNPGTSHP